MSGLLETPHTSFQLVAGVTGAIRAIAHGVKVLAGEYSLAKVAAAKAELFRRRRAELRALYLAPRDETGIGCEASGPDDDAATNGEYRSSVSAVNARRNR
jgi:hypothetical protein